jgi:hypothetical protein
MEPESVYVGETREKGGEGVSDVVDDVEHADPSARLKTPVPGTVKVRGGLGVWYGVGDYVVVRVFGTQRGASAVVKDEARWCNRHATGEERVLGRKGGAIVGMGDKVLDELAVG